MRSKSIPYLLIALISVLAIFLASRIRKAANEAAETSCRGRLFKISRAINLFHQSTGALPAALQADGKTWQHSLLPYLGDDSEECDHFQCSASGQAHYSSFVVIVGAKNAFTGNHQVPVDAISDGLVNTILVVEAPELRSRCFEGDNDPEMLEKLADGDNIAPGNMHRRGRALLFADGLMFRMARPIPTVTFRALLSISGGEAIDRDQLVDDGYLIPIGGTAYTTW
jgi:hypothetical protein